jgi:phage FluMu gp28-like protein
MAGELSKLSNLVRWLAPQFAPFDFQAEFLDDHVSRWLAYRKPRQVGVSMGFAHKRYCIAQAVPKYHSLFISLSKDDAQEKINYAKELHDAMGQMTSVTQIVTDNKTELGFSNGSVLKAVFSPRGKYRCDIDWDEVAHSSNPRRIYRDCIPIMSLGGQFTVASSVSHSGTLFNQIWEGDGGKYRHYRRRTINWWDCPIHCNDVAAARLEAADLPTEVRVERFGTETLTEIYDNMLLEDFQMEYEGRTLDDDAALLPWALIVKCSPTGDDAIETFDSLTAFLEWAIKRDPPLRVFGGYDVGRRRDAGELSLMTEENESGLFERYTETFDREAFQVQQDALDYVLGFPNTHLAIDETGMGMQMAEYLVEKHGEDRVLAVSFTNQSKAMMATTTKRYMTQGRAKFRADKDANFQMHSIKKEVTGSGNIVYNVKAGEQETERRHHGDKFWMRALAIWFHATLEAIGPTRVRFIE